MNLPNSYFEDFPIEFKEINPEDFPGFVVEENNSKIIIEPSEEGYINDALQDKISLRHKNTVVINAAVGQGKSTAIIRTIGRYYREHHDTIIIVATPFVSLVEQYCQDIHNVADIPEEQIYNYGNLGRNDAIDYRNKRIQVLTVNTLLGNPGEDAFKNSDIKRTYLNTLITHCKANELKVVFIYDEIHDAIQNFKQEFIFSLWKWRDVILKNYILSATYNEASKVVIEYLADLTERKIQIIESTRTIFPHKLSKLYLHYSPSYNFTNTTPEIVNLVENLIDKNIDILCYSKALARSIINDNEGVGKLLRQKYGTINNCTSELVSNQRPLNEAPNNRFDNNKCNVGTNFKTGVSINKANHAFIIVMPPRATRLWFRNKSGIFSQGIISVVQALARQRVKGDIHIILPKPDNFDFQSLTKAGFSEEQISIFSEAYTKICYNSEDEVNYYPLDTQDYLLTYFYKTKLHQNVSPEIEYVNSLNREELPSLQFPDYKTFKLERGEEYLANSYGFFGEDISSYITYSAFTNQFINCKLEGITYKTTLFFEEGNVQVKLQKYFSTYFGESYYNLFTTVANFSMFYQNLRKELFENFELKFKAANSEKYVNLYQYNRFFEKQLLRFCGILFFQNNYWYKDDLLSKQLDIEYSRGQYLRDCISIAQSVNIDDCDYTDECLNKIKAYRNLNIFREKIINYKRYYSRGRTSFYYLPIMPLEDWISEEEKRLLSQTVIQLCEVDKFLKHDVFNFRRNFISSKGTLKSSQKIIESFYKTLLTDFIRTDTREDSRIRIDGQSKRVKKFVSPYILPNPEYVIDTIRPKAENFSYREYIMERAEEEFGGYENFLEHEKALITTLNK